MYFTTDKMGQKTEKIFERAKVNLQKDNHENALRLFNEVLNREPKHLKALRSKALIKILNESKQDAEEFLLFAIKQQPDDDQLHQMLGTFYYNHEESNKAFAQLKKAIKMNSDNKVAHKGLGMLFAHVHGDHDEAVTHFTKAINENDKEGSADIYFNRGCSYMILDKMEEAKKDFQTADKFDHEEARKMLENYFT